MNDFYRTQMGRAFYESHVPRLIKALERIATALEKEEPKIGVWQCSVCGHRKEVTREETLDFGVPVCPECDDERAEDDLLMEMCLITMK